VLRGFLQGLTSMTTNLNQQERHEDIEGGQKVCARECGREREEDIEGGYKVCVRERGREREKDKEENEERDNEGNDL
jgi:hypothetical protein